MVIDKIRQYLMLSREPAHKDVVWVVAGQVRLATLLYTVQVATLSLLGSSFRTVLYYFVQVKKIECYPRISTAGYISQLLEYCSTFQQKVDLKA